MIMILCVLFAGLVIGKHYNDTLFFSNNDQVNINLDIYKGRRLSFTYAEANSTFIRHYQQDNQNMDDQTIKIKTDLFKHIINYPLIQSQSVLVGLTTMNDLVFLNNDSSILYTMRMTSSNISTCHQVTWFQFPILLEGVLVLCEDFKNRFTFIIVTCSNILKDGNMLKSSTCDKYYLDDSGLNLQTCPFPKLTSQIETHRWLLIQCSDTVRMLRMTEVYYRDKDPLQYGFGEGPKYELRLTDVGSLMDAFKNINMKDIQNALFTGNNTIAILDKIKGLNLARFTYDTKCNKNTLLQVRLSVRLITDLNFLPSVGEIYYTIAISLRQTLNNRISLNIDKRYYSQSFIILSDLFLYEIVLQDTSSYNSTEEIYQILVRDKINIRSRFQYNDEIKQIQIVYDTYYYYVCLNMVSSHNKCLRLTRHRKRYDQPQQEVLYEMDGQGPILIGVNNNYAISFNQTQILFFSQQGTTDVTVKKDQQIMVRLQFTGQDFYQNEFIITDLDNTDSNSNYLILGTKLDVPFVYMIPNPPNTSFASVQGHLYLSDHARGPDINAQSLPQSNDQSLFLQLDEEPEMQADYSTQYVEGEQYALVDDQYSSTMKNSLYNQSFLDQNHIITVVQKSNFQLSFIFFMLSQTTNKNITIVDIVVDAIQFRNKNILNILVSRNNFVIQYKDSKVPEYLLINVRQQKIIELNLTESFIYTFTQSVQSLDISDSYLSYQFLNNIRFNNIFALINFKNGTQCLVYQSLLKQGIKYQITLNMNYRDLDLSFLAEGIILASYDKFLYYLKLSKQQIQDRYSTSSTQIYIDQSLSSDFTFQIVVDQYYFRRSMLVIVTSEIYLYQLDNLQNKIDLLARLPRFDYTVSSKQFTINQAMLIVLMESKKKELFYFTYDLTTTGQDRLYKSYKIDNSIVIMGTMKMTSIAINQYYFCLTQQWFILQKFTQICFQDKSIQVNLNQIANNEDHTNFNFRSLFSAFQSSVVTDKIELQGSFYYQETLIRKVDPKKYPQLNIFKNETLMPQNYFLGPVLNYSLSGQDSKFITLEPYISHKNISLNYDDNQDIIEIKVNEDFLVTIGDKHISVTKVAINQDTISESTKITYSEFNDILRSKNKPPVQVCKKIFLQPLLQGVFDRSHILSIVCTIHQDSDTNESDQLIFVTLSLYDDIQHSFKHRMLFPNFLDDDPLFTTGLNFISVYNVKMITYIISQESFISFTSVVSKNLRYLPYHPEDEDDLVGIMIGLYDNKTSHTDIKSVRLRELGAQDFNKDRLIINGLQFICLEDCKYSPSSKSTQLAMFFNDLENCTLYFATLQITYDFTDLKLSKLEIIRWSSMDIREQVNQMSDQNFDIRYIYTMVEIRQNRLFIQVTTNSAAFDFTTDFNLKEMKKIDSIFRQYTDCPNPQGSLHASLSNYLTISCKNNTNLQEYQNTYIKLFVRDESQTQTLLTSVVQAIKIEDELIYFDIQKNQMGQNQFHLTTLEKVKGYQSQLRFTTYLIQKTSKLQLSQDAPKKILQVDYCASNLYNSSAFVCSQLQVSNVAEQIFQGEIINFFLLVIVPIIMIIMSYIFGTVLYKAYKSKRIDTFKNHLKYHLKLNDSQSSSLQQYESYFDTLN